MLKTANIMPDDVPLGDYFAIDIDGAIAGKVRDGDIVAEVFDGKGESADGDPQVTQLWKLHMRWPF